MNPTTARVRAACLVLALAGCGDAPSQQEAERRPIDPANQKHDDPTVFAKFVPVGKDDGRFDIAIVTYEDSKKRRVSLISAIHIADAKHFAELNEEFKHYDALLYELVAEEDMRPQPGDPIRGGILSMFQRGLQRGLELSFQLDKIDYTPDNFVHADLTPRGFAREMKKRGESFLSIFFNMMTRQQKAMQKMWEEQEDRPVEKFDFVSAVRSGYGRHMLRMTFAKSLMMIENLAAGADPDAADGEMVLLEGRNDRALEVMTEQLETGMRDLGIYYGAAHMPDIEKKLLRDHGFEKIETRWLMAWDITKRPDKKKSDEKKPDNKSAQNKPGKQSGK